MRIIIVGNDIPILKKLSKELSSIYPDSEIAILADPLMTDKYSFTNYIDILIAEINMKRMDGVQLIQFVRRQSPEIITYLLGTKYNFDVSSVVKSEDRKNQVKQLL